MPLNIIIGAQWGDEGKGRIVDLLSKQANIVARYNGGDNAGHTVNVAQQTFKLHLLPSGMIHPHTIGVIGNGVVINPVVLLSEMESLRAAGIFVNPKRLLISYAAHLITPAHLALDQAIENAKGKGKLGTTLRGIGPAYTDKVARSGLRLSDMLNVDTFAPKMVHHIETTNARLTKLYGAEPLDAYAVANEFVEYARKIVPYIQDVSLLLTDAINSGHSVLAEGAQGTLLDLNHGTYPFVTSSHPTAPGALVGLGLGVNCVDRVYGVVKAFQTRVGSGPFPTELDGDVALQLRGTGENPWDEYGTTTGRPRRVGWLDMVLLRYAHRINGLTELAITKLDVLSGIPTLKICTAYRSDKNTYTNLPFGITDLASFTPVYEEMPGWEENLWQARSWDDLPHQAQAYIRRIEDLSNVKVNLVSVGPERDQVIQLG
ncbi:MAG: adenylosuccinate synthase [Anaerolineales bacterium]|nr:adenylosuccinate synthase [Anaerolineales bacterium]